MSADEAVEKGFADEVMTFDEQQAVASIGDGLLPQAVIDEFFLFCTKKETTTCSMKKSKN